MSDYVDAGARRTIGTMNGSNIRQLERLETDMLLCRDRRNLRVLTNDELAISRLDLLHQIAANPDRDRSSQLAAAAGAAEIEASIRQQAALALIRRDADDYVLAVTPDGEHDRLDTPRLMERRAALWARSDIKLLINMSCCHGLSS